MTNEVKKKGADIFAGAFAQSLGGALSEATGIEWPFEILSTHDGGAAKESAVHFRFSAQGGLSGECFVELYEKQVAELMAKITKQPTAAGGEDQAEDQNGALTKILSSMTAGLAASLEQKYGEITFTVDRVSGLAFGGMFLVPLGCLQENVQALLYFATPLLEALSGTEEVESVARKVESSQAFAPKNLKLVMDVELNVSLRFGQRQMALRDVLELNNGSVIELDRMVDEPVELFLDGKLIARGEAVVVDGNYGLRVTEIPQPVTSHFFN
jgi:flagellar motor switch protein FliN/FliY